MKKIWICCALLAGLYSCKKEEAVELPSIHKVPDVLQQALQKQMASPDYARIDFSRAVVDTLSGHSVYRIALRDRSANSDFVLLAANRSGIFEKARIVHMEFTDSLNGAVQVRALDQSLLVDYQLRGGGLYPRSSNSSVQLSSVSPVPDWYYDVLEDFVVLAYIPNYDDFRAYLDMLFLLGMENSASEYALRHQFDVLNNLIEELVYSGGGSYAPPSVIQPQEETQDLGEPIKASEYLNCFNSVINASETRYSLTILTDIPLNNDPQAFFDWKTGAPGHTFLQLTKSGYGYSVTQNIGFYPVSGYKSVLTYTPVDSKLVDNAHHEYNASYAMALTPETFELVKQQIQAGASHAYDIDEYNCTDFALQVFNAARPDNPLQIPRYTLPAGALGQYSNTPQGLYETLVNMKNSEMADAVNVQVNPNGAGAGKSHGACK